MADVGATRRSNTDVEKVLTWLRGAKYRYVWSGGDRALYAAALQLVAEGRARWLDRWKTRIAATEAP